MSEYAADLTPEEIQQLVEEWDPITVSGPEQETKSQQPGPSREILYEVVGTTERIIRKYNATAKTFELKLKESEMNPETYMKTVFDEIVKGLVTPNSAPLDQIGITITNTKNDRPIYVSFRPSNQITSQIILNEFEKVLQSNTSFTTEEPLKIFVTQIKMPQGCGRNNQYLLLPFEEFCERKSSIIVIKNTDNLCLPRALVVAKAYLNKAQNSGHYKAVTRKNRDNILKKEAETLCRGAGITIDENGAGIPIIRSFQEYLQTYKITIFDGADRKGRKIIFEGGNESENYIDLIYNNNHFNVITSLAGAFGYRFYCRKCKVGYDHVNRHQCNDTNLCCKCLKTPPCVQAPRISCENCKRDFYGAVCYENHLQPNIRFERKKSVCEELKYCRSCRKEYTTSVLKGKQHKCGHHVCHNCNNYVEYDHLCYVQPLKKTKDVRKEKALFVFFDFECRVQDELHNQNSSNLLYHIPNYCIIQHQCYECLENYTITERCTECGERETVLNGMEGDDLLQKFFTILANATRKFKKVYVFAHNGGGYDFQFLAEYMIRVEGWKPSLILNGSKIIQMTQGRLIFKDTLNFFHARLADLPKMFGIESKTKGYFPHFFNKLETQTYEGPLPAMETYGPDEMKSEDREKFIQWYNTEAAKNPVFKFQEEIEKYCRSDVEILRQAALIFRQLFLIQLKVDPLISASTIASACMNGYRSQFLPANTIPLMTFKSYRMRDNQSQLAINYIKYFEDTYKVELQSAYRGVEKKIGRYFIDGYCSVFPVEKLNPNENGVRPLILEIHGCYFHGCPRCFPNRATIIDAGKKVSKDPVTMASRFQNTMAKMDYLENLPNNPIIIQKWECEIYAECTTNPELKKYITDKRIITPIVSNREAFYGGRTENFYRYYKVDETRGEKIRYVDVNSLYPYVNKYGEYPVGHPQIFIGNDVPRNLEGITGIAKVRILPPTQLYLPVLPIRANSKLTFALCRTCAEEENPETCQHSDEMREIIGTYTCLELRKAMEKGYIMKEIYEVWSYRTTKYDKTTKKGGLFAEYIDRFLKIKQEASGFPADVKTDSDKEAFIRNLQEREGITLELDKIKHNPGLRSLSKLCLNSLWGKFGQRNNMNQTSLIEKEATLYEFLSDPSKDITTITFLQGQTEEKDLAYIQWKTIEEASIDTGFINPIICAYVTAQARLLLYSYLEMLNERVLYCDTDSIIYIERPGDVLIETGPFLGQMGDELEAYGEGAYINEFVSGGPKNYGYCVVTNSGEKKYTIKIRGITLSYKTKGMLNFETMKDFILSQTPQPIKVTYEHKIQRKRLFKVVNQTQTKKYDEVSSKRRRLGFKTLPYGYLDIDN